jgi:hypothetical protein
MDDFDSGLDPRKLLYLKHGFFFGVHDAKDATDEIRNAGQYLRPALQITQTLKPSDEALCLANFKLALTVATWLRPRNASLLVPIKDDTTFERCP